MAGLWSFDAASQDFIAVGGRRSVEFNHPAHQQIGKTPIYCFAGIAAPLSASTCLASDVTVESSKKKSSTENLLPNNALIRETHNIAEIESPPRSKKTSLQVMF
jgi:hypothetical protein